MAINTYKKHPIILGIKQLIKNPTEVYFAAVHEDLMAKEIQNSN